MSKKLVGLIHPQCIFEEAIARAIEEATDSEVLSGRRLVFEKIGSLDCLVVGTIDLRPEYFRMTRVIAIADFVIETALFAKACGCNGLVSTKDAFSHLVDSVNWTSGDKMFLSPSVRSLLDSPAAKELKFFRKRLSECDIEVFKALGWTQQAKKIASALGMSERSVYRSLQKISTLTDDVSRDELQHISRNIFGRIRGVNNVAEF